MTTRVHLLPPGILLYQILIEHVGSTTPGHSTISLGNDHNHHYCRQRAEEVARSWTDPITHQPAEVLDHWAQACVIELLQPDLVLDKEHPNGK